MAAVRSDIYLYWFYALYEKRNSLKWKSIIGSTVIMVWKPASAIFPIAIERSSGGGERFITSGMK
jgi:hypothetical protein